MSYINLDPEELSIEEIEYQHEQLEHRPRYRLESKQGDLRNVRAKNPPRQICTAMVKYNRKPEQGEYEPQLLDWTVFMGLFLLEWKDIDQEFRELKIIHKRKWPYIPLTIEKRCEMCGSEEGARWKVPYGWDQADFFWSCKGCKRRVGLVARMHIAGPNSLLGYGFWRFYWNTKDEWIRRWVIPTHEERVEDMRQR